jgi:MFS family permease
MREAAQGAVVGVGLTGLAAAMGIGRFALTPLLPFMAGVTLAQGSALAASNYAGYLLGALACALVTMNPGTIARVGLVAVALSTLWMGATGDFIAWLVSRFAAGVASALVLVGVSSWTLHRLAEIGHAHWAGFVFAGVGVGIAFAGALVLVVHDPDVAWLALGASATAVAVLAWRPLARGHDVHDKTSAPARFDARAWLVIVCYSAFGFGYIVPATYLPSLARQLMPSPGAFGAVWPIFGLAAGITTVAASLLLRNVPPRRVWAASHAVMAVGVAAPAVAPGLASLIVAAVAVGGTFMVVTMAGMQEGRRVAGTRLMAAMTAAFAVGQLVGPILVGVLAANPRALDVASIAAAVLLVASAIALAFSRGGR